MNLTPNYNLGKPLGTEDYDIGVPNANMDIIDAALKAASDVANSAAASASNADTRLDVFDALELPSSAQLTVASGAIVATALGTQVPSSSTHNVTLAAKSLCTVKVRCWMELKMTSGTGDLRATLAWNGANTGNAQDDVYGLTAFGALMYERSISPDTTKHQADHELTFDKVFNAGTTTFSIQAYVTGTVIADAFINYATIQVTPIRRVP